MKVVNDFEDLSAANSKPKSDFVLANLAVKFANFSNLIGFQYGRPTSSHFGLHVTIVVLQASKKQMVRAYAFRIIALVKTALGFPNASLVKHPANSVRVGIPFSVYANNSVSFWHFGSNPYPAAICFKNLFPKSSLERWIKGLNRKSDGCISWLHSKYGLLCRAPGCFYSAGASTFYHLATEVSNA